MVFLIWCGRTSAHSHFTSHSSRTFGIHYTKAFNVDIPGQETAKGFRVTYSKRTPVPFFADVFMIMEMHMPECKAI